MKSVKIDRRLCVGLMILGAMSHYDAHEVVSDKRLQYIAKALKKIHYPLKNGTARERMQRDSKVMFRIVTNWQTHADIADAAWKKSADSVTKTITVSDLILALLRKEPRVAKMYNINVNKIKSMTSGKHILSSAQIATLLLGHLNSEIAYYYNEIEKI